VNEFFPYRGGELHAEEVPVGQIAADVERRDGRVKFLRLENPQPGRSIGLVFRRTSPRKSDFAALGEIVTQSLDVSPATAARKPRAQVRGKQANKKGG